MGGTGLISQTRSGVTNYFLQDGQGSTRGLANTSGAITDTYSYTAFGELFGSTGATANSYLYTGQQYDSASGLYNLRARYYNPALGRFLSGDTYPVNVGNPRELNRYVYAANSPINAMDPSGHNLFEYLETQIVKVGAATPVIYFLGTRAYTLLAYYVSKLAPYSAGDIMNFFSIVQFTATQLTSGDGGGWGGGGGGEGNDGGGSDADDSPNYSLELQKGLKILEKLAPEYFEPIENGEIILEEIGTGVDAGGSPIRNIIYFQSSYTSATTAVALYEEMFHEYQGSMLMLNAEVEAKAATAEWAQKHGLVGYLGNEGTDFYIKLYLREGEEALRERLKTDGQYRNTNMNNKVPGYLYPAPNPYPRE